VHTDANNNGLHAGNDISEITKSGFVWFCRKAPQMIYCQAMKEKAGENGSRHCGFQMTGDDGKKPRRSSGNNL